MSLTKTRLIADQFAPGIFFSLVGGASLVAIRFHSSRTLTSSGDPGPWLMPKLLGSLLLVGGILFIITQLTGKPSPTTAQTSPTERMNWRPWKLLAAVVAYALLLPWLGFLITTPAFVFTLLYASKVDWWKALIAATLLTASGQAIFVWVFMTPLPTGFWN